MQRILFRFENMTVDGDAAGDLPTTIYNGSLAVGNILQEHLVVCPARHHEPVRLWMELLYDMRDVVVSGSAVTIEAEAEFRFERMFPLG